MTRLLSVFTLILLLSNAAHAVQARSLPIDVLRARAKAKTARVVASNLRFTTESVEFTIPSGKRLTGKLMIPTVREEGERFPVLFVFGGFQHAAKVLDRIKPDVPVIFASFDYPFNAPRKFNFPVDLKLAPMAKRAVRDMIDGISEFHDVLRARDDVDSARITVVGASFGSPFALAAAANDPSISGVVLIHGFADVPQTAMHQILRKWEPKFGMLAYPIAWLLSRVGWLYLNGPAPEVSASRLTSRQRVLMISAMEDSYIPESSTTKLWKALEHSSAQNEWVIMPGDHIQGGATQLISDVSDRIKAWLERVELL